ncbi:MAG: hypothetical protein HY360_21130 [Verrucomicrobia bacterium]|nr:hypothetical protein [Verrucomicrobiota bacterium]
MLRKRKVLMCLWIALICGWGRTAEPPPPAMPAKNPAVLIVNTTGLNGHTVPDYPYLKELTQRGFQIDTWYREGDDAPPRALDWDLFQKYNVLIFTGLPYEEKDPRNKDRAILPPYRKEMMELLDRYLVAGGGVFVLPAFQGYAETLSWMKNCGNYLERWGARLPLDRIQDPPTMRTHPRSGVAFVYTDKLAPSPVSEGVAGFWYPTVTDNNWAFHIYGQPIEVSTDWTVVARGSETSSTRPMEEAANSMEKGLLSTMFHRPDQKTPPVLYAIREAGGGRLALAVHDPIFGLWGGSSWVHDRVLWDKGLAGKPSHFGKLFENTLRWLSEPSLKSGRLGGYAQNPLKLLHPNLRKKPDEYFPQFDSFQNPTPPGRVFRGLIGARTRYSSGQGSVEEYAASAKQAGLDFVIFLEEFGKRGGLTEEKYRELEADCKRLSTDALLLRPGFTFRNNIGNHLFCYGYGVGWPSATQFAGANGDELRHQCFDKDGNLTASDEDAKNWIWPFTSVPDQKNIGYYNFAGSPPTTMPVRDLRLFGILAVMTYLDGKLVEDLTPDYLNYMRDGNPPLACAVAIVRTPAEFVRAVQEKHYLTHVAANSLADIPMAMHYGHAYGRANVNPSNGPQIKSWAGTQRVMTFGGESFVPARYRIRPLCWVTSEAGLKEILIRDGTTLFRRFLLNGVKEFKQTFEWAYDRQRVLTLEVTDMEGRKALSAGLEIWSDANFHGWCHDRQNGEVWHGPIDFYGPWSFGFKSATGPTWDGGPPPPACLRFYTTHPGIRPTTGELEGNFPQFGAGLRNMEGDEYLTCWDESVSNYAAEGHHIYAPGPVLGAYSALGPVFPSKYINVSMRRTLYVQRSAGVTKESHPMWCDRAGGIITLMESTMTLKQDTDIADIHVATVRTENFPPDAPNVPIFAIRQNGATLPVCGSQEACFDRGAGIPKGLGYREQSRYTIDPGGYLAVFPAGEGLTCAIFNAGKDPFEAHPSGWWNLQAPIHGERRKAGETFTWRYLVIYDGITQPARNLHRIERLRQYYGLDGKNGSGLVVKRGKLLSQFGLVDLAPENGVVEFEAPPPGFDLQLPLGLRFIGFNPRWTVGQLQIAGYSTGYYTEGKNVYRNLASDDRDIVHLGVYPDFAPAHHSVVGHPVQCDNSNLIIEVTQISAKPPEYHVAVNNPTDAPIKTTLKKCMDLPGFEFPNKEVEVPAGGYAAVKEK